MITVVLANYNGAHYLPETLASIEAQTLPDFETILVDDGSTDNSPAILSAFAKANPKRRKLIRLPENRGQAAGFNAAADAAQGDWVCFIDSDDLWFPSKLERVEAFLIKNPEVGLLHHNLRIQQEDTPADRPVLEKLLKGDLARYHLQSRQIPSFAPTSGLAIRTTLLRTLVPIPEVFRTCADGFLTRSAMALTQVGAIQECLGAYRLHGANNVVNNPQFDVPGYIRDTLVPCLNHFYAEQGLSFRLQLKPPSARQPSLFHKLSRPLRRLLPAAR
ncbi:MAG: glycosyltransferase [Opitutales bacterium]